VKGTVRLVEPNTKAVYEVARCGGGGGGAGMTSGGGRFGTIAPPLDTRDWGDAYPDFRNNGNNPDVSIQQTS